MSEAFWRNVGTIDATREANVETWLVLPLLRALGHDERNIDSKVPIYFQEGRNRQSGRKPEADFVVYSEQPFGRVNSLITVETKRTNESLDDGRDQGESYAQNQRTPMLLMTNGVRLEVWQIQITTDSRLVFEANVADLASRRSDLEALLSREAIKAHCATIDFKRFDLLARDLGSYERALHDRNALAARSSIPRTLYEDNRKDALEWYDIFSMPGALIVGASGYGKTMLASALIWEAIERRWEGKTSMLPFDLFLPNLKLDQTIEDFFADRVAAHKPGFSASMLAELAREHGLIVVADGFERVSAERRDDVERILRTLLQDYPRTQLIVLSRVNVAPVGLGLRRLKLQGYSREDLHALTKKRTGTHPHAVNAFSSAPDHVYRFGSVPLLADRLLDRFEAQRTHAPRIAPLFEQWLDTILAGSKSVDRALDRALLEKIAEERSSGPITIERAIELSAPRSEAQDILRRLAESDTLRIYGSMLELQHEILADFLRAVRIWNAARSSGMPMHIPELFDTTSMFAILLIDTAPTAKDRATAWQAVAKADIRLAIRSLRFANGDERFGASTADDDAKRFLGDIVGSNETLVGSHFGPISDPLRAEIAGHPVRQLGIQGSGDSKRVGYSFFERQDDTALVRLIDFNRASRAPKLYGHDLQHYGYGLEAGRVLGVGRLREALSSLLKGRHLRGGPIWMEELVFGRLRHLEHRYKFTNETGMLQDALDALAPQADSWVPGNAFQAGQEFTIGELCNDIASLIQQGKSRIEPWWTDPKSLNLNTHDGQQEFSQSIDEYHRRRQIAYAEIVEHSVPALAPYLRTARMMPMRMQIEVETHNRHGYETVSLHHQRWPVENWDDAGADVVFVKEVTHRYDEAAVRDYMSRTDELLVRFGRFFPERIVILGGSTMPDFQGRDTAFDGLPDESAVVRGAIRWLKEDLDHLFAEMP